jgi:hypothetical protein
VYSGLWLPLTTQGGVPPPDRIDSTSRFHCAYLLTLIATGTATAAALPELAKRQKSMRRRRFAGLENEL